LKATSEQIFL